MSSNSQLDQILREIAAIDRMEPGKLSIIRQGPSGPYYNFQHREDGRNVTEYVPAEQVPILQVNVQSHERFQALIQQYTRLIADQSRAERKAMVQKKRVKSTSPWRKKPKSKP